MRRPLFAAFLLSCCAGVASAQLLTNGSFEDTDLSFVNDLPGNGDIMANTVAPGWTNFQTSDWMWNAGPANLYDSPDAAHFNLSAATGAFAPGVYREGVFQDLTGLDIGTTYIISFQHANGYRFEQQTGVYEGLGEAGGWQVLIDGSSLGQFPSSNDNSTVSPNFTADWQTSTVAFTATAATQEIRFVAYKPDGPQDPTFQFLDSVSVAPVPEPSSALLLGALLVGGMAIRRRS